jgi:hypothetical protein
VRRKLPQGFSRRGSSNPLSMGAFSRRKDADPYAPIRDGAKQEVQGMANKPTERQKDLASYVLPHQDSITAIREGRAGVMDVADAALSLPGLALAKPLFKGGKQVVKSIGDTDMGVAKKVVEGIGSLVGEGSRRLRDKVTGTVRGANNAATSAPSPKKVVTPKRNASQNPPKPPKPKRPPKTQTRKRPETPKSPKTPKRVDETVQTNTNTGRAPYGGRGGATTPTPKSPANPSRLQRAVTAVKNNPGKTAAAAGGTAAATAAALAAKNKGDKQTPAKKKKATGSGQNPRKGYRQSPSKSDNEELGINARQPKASKKASKKPSKQPDDGFKFYGKKGTGLGDFSRKQGMQYATQKQFEKEFNMDDGEKAGGRPGRGKLKTQGMNKAGKRKAGFSGRGSGAALRGF